MDFVQITFPPSPIWTTFSDIKTQDLKVSLELKILYILYNILHIYILKKQPPPPSFGQNPKKQQFFFVRPSLRRTQTCECSTLTRIQMWWYQYQIQIFAPNKSHWLIFIVGQLNQVSPSQGTRPTRCWTQFQKQMSRATWLSLTSLQFFSVSLSLQQKIPSAPEHFHYTIFLILKRL